MKYKMLSNYKSYISTYILYTYIKPKYNTMSQFLLLGGNRQNYYSQYKDNNFWVTNFFNAFGASFVKPWLLYLICKWFHIRVAEKIIDFLPNLEVL